MKSRRLVNCAIAVPVMICFFTGGCAETTSMLRSPGQAALLCGAGGAGAGAAIGAAAGRNWQSALIGAAAGALAGSITCFAVAEYRSRQVRDYGQTQQATGYQPVQGDAVQIVHYEITPAATPPGSAVGFNATYTVMTPNPSADITVTEVRTLSVQDPATGQWKELGRVPNQVTVKPGTRQADGQFEVRKGVAQGNYQITFQVLRDPVSDTKSLPLVVTTNASLLNSPQARIAQANVPAANPPAVSTPPTTTAPPRALSTLGEATPQAPALPARGPVAAAKGTAYFVASKVVGQGTLRSGPGPNHSVVGTINPGDRYPIVERVGASEQTWYKIRLDSGGEVWVGGSLGDEVPE